MEPIKVLLVGIGGYAANYVREMKLRGEANGAVLAGVVDPYADKSPRYEEARSMTDVFCNTVEEFYENHTADLAAICTPIPLHAPQAICCMKHGTHVLLEKPIAGTVADAQRIIDARDRTGMNLAIGFQWCSDPAMYAFRRDVQAGVFGALKSMRALVLWPRDTAYYHRGSGWAGKKYDKNGNPIFDSVASNATAHYLFNMLWVSGCELTDIQAVTARANPIETYDTIVLRGKLGDADLTYAATHAGGNATLQNPMFEYEFEKGKVTYGGYHQSGGELIFRYHDGTVRSYGISFTDSGKKRMHKLWDFADTLRGGGRIACQAEEAMLHTRVMEGVRAVCPEAHVFGENEILNTNNMYWVPGLSEQLIRCYETRSLPEFAES
ncbi:MAG: Gfo/Idh/MocA family oxidoreductase [Clostridia bacterium]|nr:Gfo/Idh/MocA family oxidoreductase [Clostridia bacterium]